MGENLAKNAILDTENDSEDLILQKCLQKIEEQLGWGSSNKWTTKDFNELSERISEVTGVLLSVTTLKRIWGKINYDSRPTTATLNALVHFIGFENWQAFRQQQILISSDHFRPVKEETRVPKKIKNKKKVWYFSIFGLGGTAALFLVYFLFSNLSMRTTETEKSFVFGSKMMVSEGVPNSIIFEYDASAASSSDSIFIQQSWDKRLTERVPINRKTHSSIYYYPGFFQAKLVVNDKIVKEQGLIIKTNGWLPVVEKEKEPVYFKTEDVLNADGALHLPIEKLKEKNILLQPEAPWVSFYNVRDFGDIYNDNFTLKTEVKNDYNEGSAICQFTEIHILFEGGVYMAPLSIKGCVSKLMLFDANGRKDDTSSLGCDLSDWVKVEYRVRNKKGKIYVNDQLAMNDLDLALPSAKIIGIRYRFQGTGSVKYLALTKSNGEAVYEEKF